MNRQTEKLKTSQRKEKQDSGWKTFIDKPFDYYVQKMSCFVTMKQK